MGNRRFELFILIALSGTLYYLGFTDKLHLLINPKYFILIILSQVFLTLFIFVKWEAKTKEKRKIKKSYVLYIVMNILLLMTSYDSFQKSIASNRTIDLSQNVEMSIETKDEESEIKEDTLILDNSNYFQVIDQIYTNPELYQGIEFSTKGFVHYNRDMIIGDYFIISRLIMLCCAADSSVYGVLVEDLPDLKENDWLDIRGTISYKKVVINGTEKTHPVIEIIEMQPIEPLSDPYIYPEYE